MANARSRAPSRPATKTAAQASAKGAGRKSATAAARKAPAAKPAKPAKPAEKAWTVMVYMAGDNNLDDAGVADLREMKQVGSTDQVAVLVQFDRAGPGQGTRRFHVSRGGSVDKDVVADLGETNCGDPKVLADFVAWGLKTHPARHVLLVLWNHGAGWDDTDIYRAARSLKVGVSRKGRALGKGRSDALADQGALRAMTNRPLRRALFATTIAQAVQRRAIALDDQARDFLDSVEMKQVLAGVKKSRGRKVDILGMDACLMNMAEVAYQVRGSVDFTVGSEEIEPGDGWPYDRVLSALVAKPATTPRQLSALIVREYLKSYPANAGVTQSALDLAQLEPLKAAVDALARKLKALPDADLATLALVRAQVQSYDTPEYVDLVDLCGQIKSRLPALAAEADAVTAQVQASVVAQGFKGTAVSDSHGVSIYFPSRGSSPLYARLDFAKRSGWDEFLADYERRVSGRSRGTVRKGLRVRRPG